MAWQGGPASGKCGLVRRCVGASDDGAIELAMAAFESQAQGEVSAEVSRERNGIPGMVRRAAWVFRKLSKPLRQQHRIEVWIDGVEVPILGYADFLCGCPCSSSWSHLGRPPLH